jgi:SAM-dependent methyltransferase
LYKEFDGDFYDENYFENGKQSGKGWLENYHWMPRRTFKEAFAFIDTLDLNENSYVLEVGCSKGFLVKALRELEIKTDGCDISSYALQFAPKNCWNCSDKKSWKEHANCEYTHIIIKDMLEHLNKSQLIEMLVKFKNIAPKMMCVIPMGDNGRYRIPEYHVEISHLIAEDEEWWINIFEHNGWHVVDYMNHVQGLKDNWYPTCENGNCVFVLERK